MTIIEHAGASAPMGRQGFKEYTMTRMGIGDPGMPFSEYERSQPIAQMSLHSQVVAPISAAVVSGILVGVLALVASLYFNWSMWVPVVAWIVATALAWFAYFSLSTGLLKTVEKVVGIDIDQDGRVGEEEKTIHWEISQEKPGGGMMWFGELPPGMSEEALKDWAEAVAVKGESLTIPRWTGRSGPFTQPAYTSLMVQMESRGLVVNYGGSRGRVLTAAARSMLKNWLK